MVLGEEAGEVFFEVGVHELGVQGFKAHILAHFLEQNLDEDAGGGRGVVLGESDAGQHAPGQGRGVKQMREELGSVTQLVCVELVDGDELLLEDLAEMRLIGVEQLAETLRQTAVEAQERSLLHAALQHHVAHLLLLPLPDVQFQQLMRALLEAH